MSALESQTPGPALQSMCLGRFHSYVPHESPSKENRRHKRLMTKATKLDLDDLLEIAAAKRWTAPELAAAAAARAGEETPPDGAAPRIADAPTATGAASSGQSSPARDVARQEEEEGELPE